MARGGTARFHDQLNAGEYQKIFDEATPDFQKAGKKEDTLAFLKSVHEKLGKVTDSTQTNFNINWTTSGTIVVLRFATKFEKKDAKENFTWKISGNKAILMGYRIDVASLKSK